MLSMPRLGLSRVIPRGIGLVRQYSDSELKALRGINEVFKSVKTGTPTASVVDQTTVAEHFERISSTFKTLKSLEIQLHVARMTYSAATVASHVQDLSEISNTMVEIQRDFAAIEAVYRTSLGLPIDPHTIRDTEGYKVKRLKILNTIQHLKDFLEGVSTKRPTKADPFVLVDEIRNRQAQIKCIQMQDELHKRGMPKSSVIKESVEEVQTEIEELKNIQSGVLRSLTESKPIE